MKLAHIQERLQACVLGPGEDCVHALPLLRDGPGIPRELRLGIYHNAYRARLREALQSVFERTWAYLGDESFDAACARFIEAHPSTSPNLRDYGAGFPGALRESLRDDPEVAELATMDWNLHVAFDAPDVALLDHTQLSALGEEDWACARFAFHPGMSIAVFEWNTLEIWHALDKEEAPPPARRLGRPVAHLFWRSRLASRFRSLEDAEFDALRDLAAGMPFAAVCERVPPEQAGAWLRDWIVEELLRSPVAGRP